MKNKAVAYTFIMLLICCAALFLMPADKDSFKSENRTQAKMPSLTSENVFSGEFANDFESYVNDSIAFRSKFTDASHFIESNKGITPPDGKVVYTDKDIGTETVKKACLLIADGKIMEVFAENPTAEKTYADAINKVASEIDENIDVYSMLVPTQLEFAENVYKNIQNSQLKAIERIYSMLLPRIKGVDVYSALKEHRDEYIYFRSDHHWTMLGSYYGYNAFMKEKGSATVSKDNFEKKKVEGFFGYLYEQYPDRSINPDVIEWYDVSKVLNPEMKMHSIREDGSEHDYTAPMFDETKNNYDLFMSSDHPYVEITNNQLLSGETLLIIRDSYASVFVPWCVNNYKRIIMIDPRTYKENLRDVFHKYKIDDVLFLNYIFTTSFEDYCDKMIGIFN